MLELLVVISTIGLLITIMVPSLKRSMGVARSTVCMHNLREVHRALEMYRYDNDGWLPVVVKPEHSVEAINETNPWFVAMFPTYLQDPLILSCPEDPFRYRMMKVGSFGDGTDVNDYSSYGINQFMMTSGSGYLAEMGRYRPGRPSDTIFLADLGPDYVTGSSTVGVGPKRNESLLAWDDNFRPFAGEPRKPWLTKRHGDGIHMLTVSGGVRHSRTTDIMNSPMRRFYENCAAGGCTFCTEFSAFHYSFARDRLFWWVGPKPSG